MSSILPEDVFQEVRQILDMALDYPASQSYDIKYFDSNASIHIDNSKCSSGCFGVKDFELEIDEENHC